MKSSILLPNKSDGTVRYDRKDTMERTLNQIFVEMTKYAVIVTLILYGFFDLMF